LVGTTVFGDGKQSVIAQAQSTAQLQGWLNLSQQWGGTIQGSNSRYTENNSIPLRFTSALSPGSQHTVLLKYDFSSGVPGRFLDSLTSFDTTTNANVLAGISNAGAPTKWAIPPDTSLPAGAQPAGFITSYNISNLQIGNYTLLNGVKVLPVTFTVASGNG